MFYLVLWRAAGGALSLLWRVSLACRHAPAELSWRDARPLDACSPDTRLVGRINQNSVAHLVVNSSAQDLFRSPLRHSSNCYQVSLLLASVTTRRNASQHHFCCNKTTQQCHSAITSCRGTTKRCRSSTTTRCRRTQQWLASQSPHSSQPARPWCRPPPG